MHIYVCITSVFKPKDVKHQLHKQKNLINTLETLQRKKGFNLNRNTLNKKFHPLLHHVNISAQNNLEKLFTVSLSLNLIKCIGQAQNEYSTLGCNRVCNNK